jgi:hypothetical protein
MRSETVCRGLPPAADRLVRAVGTYLIVIDVFSAIHNFHVIGPGINKKRWAQRNGRRG